MTTVPGYGAASQPNGGKPPRHKVTAILYRLLAIPVVNPIRLPGHRNKT
ncbi:hypothetical protein OKW11_001122 [Pseudomonas baetica]|nr:hypothetical protein [Pseudomonas baetica]